MSKHWKRTIGVVVGALALPLLLDGLARADKPANKPSKDGGPQYTVKDLGVASSAYHSHMNDLGEVVGTGWAGFEQASYLQVDLNGVEIPDSRQPLPDFGFGSHALGINLTGGVVGAVYLEDGSPRGAFWQLSYHEGVATAPAAPTVLEPVGGDTASYAGGVNNDGVVVGVSGERAAAWKVDAATGLVTDSMGLPDLSGTSYAWKINDNGRAAGAVDNDTLAAYWQVTFSETQELSASLQHVFGLLDGKATRATGVNENDDICGSRAGTIGGAWLSLDGGTVGLLPYLRKYVEHCAYALRNVVDPQEIPDVVGSARHSTWGNEIAVLWRDGEAIDLNKTFRDGTLTVTRAAAITVDGRILCVGKEEVNRDKWEDHLYVLVPK